MAALQQFEFDCPACGARRRISPLQREALLTCTTCGIQFPGPDFRTNAFDYGPPPRGRTYACSCMACGDSFEAREADSGRPVRCASCAVAFRQPPPAWERWRRPVAKTFSRAEQRYSLQHLMRGLERWLFPGRVFEPRERRSFEFYCGACGHLQAARVCDIATQRFCRVCDALLIVPAPGAWRGLRDVPVRRRARVAAAVAACSNQEDGKGLFCPHCGRNVPHADRSRRQQSFCGACALWF